MTKYIDDYALMKDFDGIDLTKCVKYGNNDAEQLNLSYSTMMMYEIASIIDDAPAADVVEVKHGRWGNAVCTVCGFDLRCLTDGESCLEQWVWDGGFDYCPNCGAKMDEEGR